MTPQEAGQHLFLLTKPVILPSGRTLMSQLQQTLHDLYTNAERATQTFPEATGMDLLRVSLETHMQLLIESGDVLPAKEAQMMLEVAQEAEDFDELMELAKGLP